SSMAAAGTVNTIGSTVSYGDSGHFVTRRVDTPPGPIGGMGNFASKLFYPPKLRGVSNVGPNTCVVSVLIEKSGKVASISFSPRMNPEFEAIVVGAVRACRWHPASDHGTPFRSVFCFP